MGRIAGGTRGPRTVVLSWEARGDTAEEVISEQMMGQTQPGVEVGEGPSHSCRRDPHWWGVMGAFLRCCLAPAWTRPAVQGGGVWAGALAPEWCWQRRWG